MIRNRRDSITLLFLHLVTLSKREEERQLDTHTEALRHIKIEGCYNLRDVGGYPTHDGRRTRWRTLLRSDSPHRLTPASWRELHGYGVRTIIDLRRPGELLHMGYSVEVAGVRYRHLPIFDDEAQRVVDPPARDLDELYRLLLDHCGAQFGGVLRAIAADGGAPALIHCAVGKDRTGLTIALALGVAGVDRETIAEDYSLSSALLSPLNDEIRASEREQGADMERLERILESRHDTMLRALAYIDERFGGVASYLARAGMPLEELERLNAVLVERE
jgi:protein-tyrosine phosphatase